MLLALLGAGLIALYPPFAPPLLFGMLATCIALVAMRVRRRRAGSMLIGRIVLQVLLVMGLVVTFNIVSFVRAVKYWNGLLYGGVLQATLPRYGFLRLGVIPSWLDQSRQFYDLAVPGGTLLARVGLTVVVPLLLATILVTGLRHHVAAWLLVSVLAAASAIGVFERVANTCTYCADRSLLPIGPILAVLVCLGIAELASSSSGWTASSRDPRGVCHDRRRRADGLLGSNALPRRLVLSRPVRSCRRRESPDHRQDCA